MSDETLELENEDLELDSQIATAIHAASPGDEPEETPQVEDTPEPELEQVDAAILETVNVNGLEIPAAQLQNAVRLMHYGEAHPEVWEALVEAERYAGPDGWNKVLDLFRTGPQPSVQPEPELETDDLDFLDPRVSTLQERLDQLEAEAGRRRQDRDWQATNAGVERFFETHSDLSEDDRARVLLRANELRVIPQIIARLPDTEREDPHARATAVQQALEMAHKIEFFDQVAQQATANVVRDLSARQRTRMVAGSHVSAPRVAPEPTTDEERDAAMVAEIRAALQQ